MKETASSLLQQEVYDWVIGSLKKRIVLAKSKSGLAIFFSRDVQTMVVMHIPLLLLSYWYVKRT